MNYYEKYLKYKSKYLTLVNQVGGLHKIKLNDVKNIIFKINTILSSEEYMNFNTYENIVSIAENATLDEFIIYYLFNYNNKIFRVSNVDKLTHNLFDNISINVVLPTPFSPTIPIIVFFLIIGNLYNLNPLAEYL